jgi:hypothetical protein
VKQKIPKISEKEAGLEKSPYSSGCIQRIWRQKLSDKDCCNGETVREQASHVVYRAELLCLWSMTRELREHFSIVETKPAKETFRRIFAEIFHRHC